MTDTLTRVRAEVDALLDSLRAELDATAEREAAVAAAAEALSQDAAVRAAYQQGQTDEQRRLLTLIDLQLQHLAPGSASAVLHTLRRMVEGGDG